MPAFTAPIIMCSTHQADTNSAALVRAHALHLRHYWPASSTVVVGACGDIDASNAHDLIVFVRYAIGSYRGLVLDLRAVTFFGTEGLSALCIIDQADTPASRIAVVPSPVVVRLIRLCTPAPAMPIVDDLDAALVAVQSDRPVLQLVTAARL